MGTGRKEVPSSCLRINARNTLKMEKKKNYSSKREMECCCCDVLKCLSRRKNETQRQNEGEYLYGEGTTVSHSKIFPIFVGTVFVCFFSLCG